MKATNVTTALVNNVTTAIAGVSESRNPLVAHETQLAFGIVIPTMCFIASILSVVLIAAMTLPLATAKGRKEYSTYNLYLAFLSVPDLVANIFIIYIVVTNTQWRIQNDEYDDDDNNNNTDNDSLWFEASPYDDGIYTMTVAANLYINAFLTYEIYKLLKYSSLRKRYYPPTTGKVTKQALFCYGMGLFVFVVDFFVVADRIDKNVTGASPQMLKSLDRLHLAFCWIVCVLIPLLVLMVVSGMIYWQGLIESTKSLYEGRLRVLALFFLRIVVLEIAIWVPSAIAFSIQWTVRDERTKIIAYYSSLFCASIQVFVNFVVALTKPDTKKLIVGLPHRVCCDCWQLLCKEEEANDDGHDITTTTTTTKQRFKDPFLRMRRSSVQSTSARNEENCNIEINPSCHHSDDTFKVRNKSDKGCSGGSINSPECNTGTEVDATEVDIDATTIDNSNKSNAAETWFVL